VAAAEDQRAASVAQGPESAGNTPHRAEPAIAANEPVARTEFVEPDRADAATEAKRPHPAAVAAVHQEAPLVERPDASADAFVRESRPNSIGRIDGFTANESIAAGSVVSPAKWAFADEVVTKPLREEATQISIPPSRAASAFQEEPKTAGPQPERATETENVPLRFRNDPAVHTTAAVTDVRAKPAPDLHIGSIEIEVVPPAPEPVQVAAAPRRDAERKRPLSRSYSTLFGWGQS
jgi:hypothetical protein